MECPVHAENLHFTAAFNTKVRQRQPEDVLSDLIYALMLP